MLKIVPWLNDFRTFKWVDSVKYPEITAGEIQKLLKLTNS